VASVIVVALAVAAALAVAILVYRANAQRAPYLEALANGEVSVESLPEDVQLRLASVRHRAGLANALRKAAKDAAKVRRTKMMPNPAVNPYMDPQVRDEMRRVADLLTEPTTSSRAVAMAEVMLGDGRSPLYGESEADLFAALAAISDASS
jgi:hypothetical protein